AWPPPCCCTHPAPPRAPLFPYTTLFRSLVAGVADELRHSGISVFGPGRRAAGIEGSKSFAKDVMHAAGVPTAATMPIARPPCVRSEEHTSELQSRFDLVCRLLLEKKKTF